MNIKECISILEEHKEDLEDSKACLYSLGTFLDLCEALDFAVDSLKAIDESLIKTEVTE